MRPLKAVQHAWVNTATRRASVLASCRHALTVSCRALGRSRLRLVCCILVALAACVPSSALAKTPLRPASCSTPHLCGAHTYIAVFGQLSVSDPNFTGQAHDYQRPHVFSVTSLSNRISFTKLKWRHWGAATSSASGHARTCGDLTGDSAAPTSCQTNRVRLQASTFAPLGSESGLRSCLRSLVGSGFQVGPVVSD